MDRVSLQLNHETARKLLQKFFDTIADSFFELVEPNDPRMMSQTYPFEAYTDIQLKKFQTSDEPGKWYYCLNFAMISESEEQRKKALVTLKVLEQTLYGRRGKGIFSDRKRLRISEL